MPTLLDLIAAVPHCRRRRMTRRGQHGVHFTCYQPMKYNHSTNAWRCPVCKPEGRTQ